MSGGSGTQAGNRAGNIPGFLGRARPAAARCSHRFSWGYSNWQSEWFQETPSSPISPAQAKLCPWGPGHHGQGKGLL